MTENKLTLSSCLMPLCTLITPERSQDHFSTCVSACLHGYAHVSGHMCMTVYGWAVIHIYAYTYTIHIQSRYEKYRVLKIKRSSSCIPCFFCSLILFVTYLIYKGIFVRKNHCVSSFISSYFKLLKALNSTNCENILSSINLNSSDPTDIYTSKVS